MKQDGEKILFVCKISVEICWSNKAFIQIMGEVHFSHAIVIFARIKKDVIIEANLGGIHASSSTILVVLYTYKWNSWMLLRVSTQILRRLVLT